jgi:predicted phosphodiesterase
MNIEAYCKHYGLDVSKIRSYKLISHSGVPFYNVVFYEEVIESLVTEDELKQIIAEGFNDIKYTEIKKDSKDKVGVVKIADLHLGSYVDNLIRTKNFSINILANKLLEAVNDINDRGYSVVHIHILGDLIESFTGLSHKNTWKGLDKAMVGAEAVKLVVKILHDNFLSKIINLGDVKVVAGNHDRVTSDNKEDVQGGAASLVCWGLELIGYNVEFNSLVITHTVGKITHILTHGHHALSKKSTKQLCWDYGVQGNYNLICEGHLHSIIQKLNINQRDTYQTIKDDAVDHRRMNCPSFFTGNFFSESLGYTSESGFVITEDNGNGVPNVFYYAV